MGDGRSNMPTKRQELSSRGPVGKTAIVGAKDRARTQACATVVEQAGKANIRGFVAEYTASDAIVFTDHALVYESRPNRRPAFNHSALEYVQSDVHFTGIESLWSILKRGVFNSYQLSKAELEEEFDVPGMTHEQARWRALAQVGVRNIPRPKRNGRSGGVVFFRFPPRSEAIHKSPRAVGLNQTNEIKHAEHPIATPLPRIVEPTGEGHER